MWSLSNRTSPDSMPIIADLVGLRTFLRLAAKHKLTRSFLTLRWWLAPALVVGVVAVGALVRVVDAILKAQTGGAPTIAGLLSDWTFLSLTAVAAAVALGSQQLLTFLSTRTKSDSLKTFRQDLESKERSGEYDAFVESLAACLGGWPFPRSSSSTTSKPSIGRRPGRSSDISKRTVRVREARSSGSCSSARMARGSATV